MNETQIYINILLAISNIAFIYLYFKERKKKFKNPPSNDAVNELLVDLMKGEAVIKCTRIVPTDIFLRSPRHGRA